MERTPGFRIDEAPGEAPSLIRALGRLSRRPHRDGVLALGAAATVMGVCGAFTRADADRSCLYRLAAAVPA